MLTHAIEDRIEPPGQRIRLTNRSAVPEGHESAAAYSPLGNPAVPRNRPRARHAALRVNAFEVADQQEPEVHGGRQTRAAHRLGVEGGALTLDEIIETMLAQQLVQAPVEGMARRGWQLRGRHSHRWLAIALSFAHRHAAHCSTWNDSTPATECQRMK